MGSGSFRSEIEGLRALAVSAVICHHFAGLDGGFVGVDIFFVISGYLIGGLLVRELVETRRIDLIRFLARRARRLLPNALLTLGVTLVLGLLVMPASQWAALSKNVSAAVLYYANFQNAASTTGYFDAGIATNPTMHFWSLSIEEQFYIGIACIFALAALARSYAAPLAVLAVLVVTVASFAASVLADSASSGPNFFLTQLRVWELGVGILAAVGEGRVRQLVGRGAGAVALSMLVVLLALPFLPLSSLPWPGVATLAPILATALFLTTAGEGGWAERILGNRPVQWIGRRSYSLYLWHWPVAVLSRFAFEEELPVVVLVVLTAIVSELAYRFVENPIRFGPAWKATSVRTAFVAALTCVVAFFAPQATVSAAKMIAPAKVQRAKALEANAFSRSRVELEGCFSVIGRWADPERCRFGDVGSPRRILLMGDSHAMHWFDGLEPAAADLGYRLDVELMQACPPVRVLRFYAFVKGPYLECIDFVDRALARTLADPPDIVVLSMLGTSAGVLVEPGVLADRTTGSLMFQDALIDTVEDLKRAGSRVVLVIDTPNVMERFDTCVERGDTRCWFAFPRYELNKADRLAAARMEPDVTVVDFTPKICPDDQCVTFDQGLFTYRDTSHLSPRFSASLEVDWIRVLSDARTSTPTGAVD